MRRSVVFKNITGIAIGYNDIKKILPLWPIRIVGILNASKDGKDNIFIIIYFTYKLYF